MVARSERSDPASHAMIWMGAASPPSCGVAGVRGRQRSAISMSAWDGPSRRAARAQTGPGVRSEQHICECIRCDAESRRTAAARSGIIGLTIRDASCCHRMAVGIRRMRGRLSVAKPCVCVAVKCVRLRRRGCDAFGRFAHSAWVSRVWPVGIRWLGSDLRSGQRRADIDGGASAVARRSERRTAAGSSAYLHVYG
jgi:hypothetical protein